MCVKKIISQLLLVILFLCITTSSLFAQNAQDDDLVAKLKDLRERVLAARIIEILNHRQPKLYSCYQRTQLYYVNDTSTNVWNVLRAGTKDPALLLRTYGLSENMRSVCAREITEADEALKVEERRRYSLILNTAETLCGAIDLAMSSSACVINVSTIISELDPHCSLIREIGLDGYTQTSTCYAGDYMIGRTLRKSNDPDQEELKIFLEKLISLVENGRAEEKIDLVKLYLENHSDSAANRERFLAMMLAFKSTPSSGFTHMDGVIDLYWQQAYEETHSVEATLNEYHQVRQKVDLFRYAKNTAEKKSIHLVIGDFDTTGTRHHEFAAAYLSCHYRKNSYFTSRVLPKVLGLIYKISWIPSVWARNMRVHKPQGAEHKLATGVKGIAVAEHYVADGMARYDRGTKFGYDFCSAVR